MDKKTRKELRKGLTFVVLIFSVLVVLKLTRKQVDEPEFAWLERESERANVNAPAMLNNDVRFEGTYVTENIFTHSYTMVNATLNEIDLDEFSTSIDEQLLGTVCKQESAQAFF